MRIRTCWLSGLGRAISELSSALALTVGIDWAEEKTDAMRKSSETLSRFIAKSWVHWVSCVESSVRHVMSSGPEKMPEKWVWDYPFPGILPRLGGSKSLNPNCRSSFFQGLQGVGVLRILAG